MFTHILSRNQYGFRPKVGTENALFYATKFIYDKFDKSEKVTGIFLDMAKAFNAMDHTDIINLLSNFGIKKSSLKWFKSYLVNRKQKVKINGITGDDLLITCGVPQESVLGPTLYLLYINNICDLDINGQVITNADDTCLLFSGVTWDDVLTKAMRGFKK